MLCVLALTWLVVFDWNGWWIAVIVAGSHLVIDAVKPYVQRRCGANNELWVFIIDQMFDCCQVNPSFLIGQRVGEVGVCSGWYVH